MSANTPSPSEGAEELPRMQQPKLMNPSFPVPRGLESLIQLDQIIVNAQKDVGDYENDLAGKYTPNKYKIHNSVGQEIFHANEGNIDFDACVTRAPFRKFSMKINDNLQNEVIY